MMHTVSVIIPVFNGEKYISGLFEQMMLQTYGSIEVLCVDDGSRDGSADVINEKISRYVRDGFGCKTGDRAGSGGISFRLVRQANAGQGGARNRGIEEASGEYLMFLDQDDRIRNDYVETLVKAAEKNGSDIVISGYEHVAVNGEVKEHVELTDNEWCRFMNITPWGKLYRRDYIIRENIRFLPVPLGEDIYFNVMCYSHTDRVDYTEYVGYKWVINESSVSNTIHRKINEKSQVLGLFDALIGMDSADMWKDDPQYRYFLLKTGIFHILYAAKNADVKELLEYNRKIFEWLDEHIPGYMDNRLIAWDRPAGERASVRRAVFLFVILKRMHLDGLFLRVFHILP